MNKGQCIVENDRRLTTGGVFFLPFVGGSYENGFHGRKLLILGESHYARWQDADGEYRYHDLPMTFTRDCIADVIGRSAGCARFWRSAEQALVNEQRYDGWCPSGGEPLWKHLAFYNFVQATHMGGPRQKPSEEAFSNSIAAFRLILEALRPDRVLVCGKRLWQRMGPTKAQMHEHLEAYDLSDQTLVWCLAINHPSSGRFSWLHAYQLLRAFLNSPESAFELLRNS